jgi:parvulin-like peptidyl-prolyl isomerase
MAQMLQMEITEEATPNEAAIEKYYKDNQSAFDEVTLRRIFIPRQPKQGGGEKTAAESAAEVEAAKKVRDRAAAGEDLDAIEKEVFLAANPKGVPPPTTFGARRRKMLPPQEVEAVFSLKPGEISQPFESPGAFIIYKVESKRTLPFADVKEEIRQSLLPQRQSEAMTAILGKVKTDLNPAYFPEPKPAPAAAVPPTGPGRDVPVRAEPPKEAQPKPDTKAEPK